MGSDNKLLMVLANQDFQDAEYNETYEALRAAGIEVSIAATLSEECKGADGTEVSVDYSIDEVNTDEFQGIVIIGGTGVEQYLHDVTLHELIRNMMRDNKIVAAICWAPAVLANSKVLLGRRATSWSGAIKDLVAGGATILNMPVVEDGNVITANGPDAASAFGQAIAKAILE